MIFPSSSKLSKKTLISTVLWLLYDFLSLKNDANLPSKINKRKNILQKIFLVVLLKDTDEKSRFGVGSRSESQGRYKYAILCHRSETLLFSICSQWRYSTLFTQKKLRNPCYQIGYCTSCISTGATLVYFCLQQQVLPSQSMR
jgi:hypothetical protein